MDLVMGVDTGMHSMGVAIVDETKRVLQVEAINTPNKFTGKDAILYQINMFRSFLNRIDSPYPWGIDKTVIEFPVIKYLKGGKKVNPESIKKLAAVAGGVYGVCSEKARYDERFSCLVQPFGGGDFVEPTEWKGTVPKLQHHRRICASLGWSWREEGKILIPGLPMDVIGREQLNKKNAPDIMDAIGLALWGLE